MADHVRFGPAGVPHYFRLMSAKLSEVPRLLQAEGLDAFEYEAVRWGQKPQIRQEEAEKLGAEARANDVLLSLHGSYYINLSGEPAVAEASKRRLVACATAAEWMGAYVVVFHTGFYGHVGKAETSRKCTQALKEALEQLETLGVSKVKLGPEMMGRHSQFGTFDEILTVCQQVERAQLVIDWAHLHARSGGGLRTLEDFRKIVVKAEEVLGTEAVRNMHCHFSKIEFTYRAGERRHHVLDEKGCGPDFEMLAQTIAEFHLKPVIISETMLQDVDARKMRDIYRQALKAKE